LTTHHSEPAIENPSIVPDSLSHEPKHHHGNHPLKIASVIGALGIVFGDIGTSPLYAFKEPLRIAMEGGVPLQAAVYGVLSLIFWAITLTISIKYVLFILRADNDGEGGDLALVTSMRLHKTKSRRNMILVLAGLTGTSMLFGDGVITPAISVLSAVEGLNVVAPSIDHWVVHIAIAIIIGIFVSQRFGTEKIGVLFGPIIVLWFGSIGALGITGIMQYPQIFAALNPIHAVHLIASNPGLTSAIIGAIVLAVTGGEALYVDLGHFGRNVIKFAWFGVAMPGLLLNYLGQGALMMASPVPIENPFFQLAPVWFGLPLLILATFATVVASQAVITGAFSIARQTVEIGYFPPMRMKITSEKNTNHIFIPRINMALMFLTLLVVVLFQTSSALASAYGIAVSVAMTMTTILFSAWMFEKSGWSKPIILMLAFCFMCLDLSFLLTNLTKVAAGGWLPLMMGAGVLIAMLSWHRGIEKLIERHMGYTEPIEQFAARIVGAPLVPVHKVGVFFSRTGVMAPVALERITNMLHVKFDKTVILSVRIASRPRVDLADRLHVFEVDHEVIKIEVKFGYLQITNIPATIGPALAKLGIHSEDMIYIIGHERVIAPSQPACVSDLMNILFGFLASTAERSVDRFHLPTSRTLEVGYPVQM
jgi:KUP system potassium uptake protein